MNKAQLIDQVKERLNSSKREAEKIVNVVIGTIQETLKNGDKVAIQGFGTFKTRYREEHTARNPKTGEEVVVPAKHVPVFKAGKQLKEAVK